MTLPPIWLIILSVYHHSLPCELATSPSSSLRIFLLPTLHTLSHGCGFSFLFLYCPVSALSLWLFACCSLHLYPGVLALFFKHLWGADTYISWPHLPQGPSCPVLEPAPKDGRHVCPFQNLATYLGLMVGYLLPSSLQPNT